MKEFTDDEKEVLQLRSNVAITDNDTTCYHNDQFLFFTYSFLQKKCCDPFSVHNKKGSKSSLREISLNMWKQLKEIGRVAKPGQKSAWSANQNI